MARLAENLEYRTGRARPRLNSATTWTQDGALGMPQGLMLAGYVLLYLLVWSLVPLVTHWNVPDDNLEQLAWVLTPDWGYNKHPPFPTWVLWGFEQLAPHGVALTYLLGALQVGMMLGIAWRLCLETLCARRALVAVLLISGMTYYTNRLHYFNHNTALLVCHAGAMYCAWRCVSTGRLVWWWLLGFCWGIGMLSKYQMLLSIACTLGFLGWLASRPEWRGHRSEFLRGTLLAGTLCAALLAPHVAWLFSHDFPTFSYASHSMAADLPLWKRPVGLFGFLANQLWRVLPVVALALLMLRSQRKGGAASQHEHEHPDRSAAVRALYVTHAAGPFALMALLALAAGIELQMHWGTAFLWALAPLCLLTARGRRLAALPTHQLFACFLLVQVLTLAYQAFLRSA
jgi:4-amino-4-deoxy-L-arabinose transferase-like glycosyltransferase